MGRRPNVIVSEFFERGAKLEDASNRYQHTCRRCGAIFPKGRIDSLMAHLLKRCPNVTQEDRNAVFLHMQHNPDGKRKANTEVANGSGNHLDINVTDFGIQQDFGLPSLLERQQSALDTLAEVSRRHLDYSSQRNAPFEQLQETSHIQESEQNLAEQALWAQLHQNTIDTADNQSSLEAYGLPLQRSLYQEQTNAGAEQHVFTSETYEHTPLVQTATAANEQLDQAQQHTRSETHTLDPQLDQVDHNDFVVPGQSINRLPSSENVESSKELDSINDGQTSAHISSAQPNFITWTPRTNHGDPHQNSLAEPNSPGQTTMHRSKPRGRFSESRRKEVQEVRKRGACLRCRMLKKPCSEGTPCSTCAGVETARLWKGKCLRTRLADEFGAWNTGLFYAVARGRMAASLAGMRASQFPGRLEVKLWNPLDEDTASLWLTFPVKRYTKPVGTNQQELGLLTSDLDPGQTSSTVDEVFVLDGSDDIAEKLSAYCVAESTIVAAIESEPHPFLQATLRQVQYLLARDNDPDVQAPSQAKSEKSGNQTRHCYNFADLLTRNVLELWILTTLITTLQDPVHSSQPGRFPQLSVAYDPLAGPSLEPQEITGLPSETKQSILPTTPNYQLIETQLLAAVETRSAKLGRLVMGDLERRLLQRQQVSGFATLIAAVVLLSCVERMTSYYHNLDPSATIASAVQAEIDDRGLGDPSTFPPNWPLTTSARSVWTQGPPFAALLTILLRMRGLPPRTVPDHNGHLVAAYESDSYPMKSNVTSVAKPQTLVDEGRQSAIREWLDQAALDADEARSLVEGKGDGWQGRFMAAVLMDEV